VYVFKQAAASWVSYGGDYMFKVTDSTHGVAISALLMEIEMAIGQCSADRDST
jgi:hypothetical protein